MHIVDYHFADICRYFFLFVDIVLDIADFELDIIVLFALKRGYFSTGSFFVRAEMFDIDLHTTCQTTL